jgi:hypothetical protein
MSKNKILHCLVTLILLFSFKTGMCQYQSFEIDKKGDTVNIVDNKGLKQGWWIINVPELRGEPATREIGWYKDGKKEGEWHVYNGTDDLIAIENYAWGGKHGISKYFNRFGNIIREESWKAYNPDSPYDTIPIYDEKGDLQEYKTVKAEMYSVKDGTWKFYESSTGRLLATEKYFRGAPLKADDVASDKPKPKVKPKEVIEFEKKHSGKKATKVVTGEVH